MKHRTTIATGVSLAVASVLLAAGCSRGPGPVPEEINVPFSELPRRDLARTVSIAKQQWLQRLLDEARTDPPTPAEANELFELVRHDPDFRMKMRAMHVLPFVPEREQAIDVLIEALQDRDPESSGGLNVPYQASRHLEEMNATRAIPAMENFIAFLEEQKPQSRIRMEMRASMLDGAKKTVAALKAGDATAH